MRYFEEARTIWSTLVPARGRADTVQGELLRAVEKLRDEAVRNGNVNWNASHAALATFVDETLTSSNAFDSGALAEIHSNIKRALVAEYPAGDDLYDQLADRVVEWCRANPAPVPNV